MVCPYRIGCVCIVSIHVLDDRVGSIQRNAVCPYTLGGGVHRGVHRGIVSPYRIVGDGRVCPYRN